MGATPFLELVVDDRELLKSLRALSQNVRNKVTRPALRKAMKPILAAAKANAPYRTGALRDGYIDKNGKKRGGIKVYVNKNRTNGEVYAVIKATSPHSKLIEYGGRAPLFGNRNYWYDRPAHPFLRPAMDAHREEALNTISEYLQKAWDEVKH